MTLMVVAGLRRHRAWSAAALAALTLLAWWWLVTGAGMGGTPAFALWPGYWGPPEMAGMAGMRDMPGMTMSGTAAPSGGRFAIAAAMWLAMMVAMMLPSAAPMILLYARASTYGTEPARPHTASFLGGYLAVWGAFALLAAALQAALEGAGLVGAETMALHSREASGAILLAVGLYQLSPVKNACLRQCRGPAAFLARHYRPRPVGALRMGLIHGAYCIGCCWLLMALLFVGGVMNLAWIAFLTLLVAAEKLLPHGGRIALASGVACIVGSVAVMAV